MLFTSAFNKNHNVGIRMAGVAFYESPKFVANIYLSLVTKITLLQNTVNLGTKRDIDEKTPSYWADKRQADLYCTKRNEPLCTPLMSDCPIIHTVDRVFLRFRVWFSDAQFGWSTALIQWYEWKARVCVNVATWRGRQGERRLWGSGGAFAVLRGQSHIYRSDLYDIRTLL